MPYDIILCTGEGCPISKYCKRSTLEVLGRQDFFGSVPFDSISKDCSYFFENEVFRTLQRQSAYQLWQQEGEPQGKDLEHWQAARKAVFYYLTHQINDIDPEM